MSDHMKDPHAQLGELYDLMLMEYASGALDDALSLLVASHLTLSAVARQRVAFFESLGGALMDECCEPVSMAENALNAVLGKLESCGAESPCTAMDIMREAGIHLPQPLQQHMKARACNTGKWHRAPGHVRVMPIPLAPCKMHYRALLMKARPGAALPRMRHISREYCVVLQGNLRRREEYYHAGDLFVIESESAPRPVVDAGAEGVCLVVSDAPARRRASWFDQFFPFGF
ncbi:MAG TPA: cupin domain-containing protein [Patescibacteria group bacterium]|nr:cupin domain-containing protein [Patescibacteria group bacterium]